MSTLAQQSKPRCTTALAAVVAFQIAACSTRSDDSTPHSTRGTDNRTETVQAARQTRHGSDPDTRPANSQLSEDHLTAAEISALNALITRLDQSFLRLAGRDPDANNVLAFHSRSAVYVRPRHSGFIPAVDLRASGSDAVYIIVASLQEANTLWPDNSSLFEMAAAAYSPDSKSVLLLTPLPGEPFGEAVVLHELYHAYSDLSTHRYSLVTDTIHGMEIDTQNEAEAHAMVGRLLNNWTEGRYFSGIAGISDSMSPSDHRLPLNQIALMIETSLRHVFPVATDHSEIQIRQFQFLFDLFSYSVDHGRFGNNMTKRELYIQLARNLIFDGQ